MDDKEEDLNPYQRLLKELDQVPITRNSDTSLTKECFFSLFRLITKYLFPIYKEMERKRIAILHKYEEDSEFEKGQKYLEFMRTVKLTFI